MISGFPSRQMRTWPIDLELYDQNDQNKSISTTNLDDIDFTSIDELKKHEKYFVPTIKIENEKRGGFRRRLKFTVRFCEIMPLFMTYILGKAVTFTVKCLRLCPRRNSRCKPYTSTTKQNKNAIKQIQSMSFLLKKISICRASHQSIRSMPHPQYHSKDTRLSLDNYLNLHGEYMRDQYSPISSHLFYLQGLP